MRALSVSAFRGVHLTYFFTIKISNKMKETQTTMEAALASGISRRRFFGYAGALAGAGLLVGMDSCKKDDEDSGVNLGSGDYGVLNYAYALEQLEAAFYIQVLTTLYTGVTTAEKAYLTDVRDHEVIHREFFKAALGANAIQGLTPNFSSINFADRASVLGAAKTFEDLGVSAYNGAGRLISNTPTGNQYLLAAGKIVSVEARHAAAIRDLLSEGSFAASDVIDTKGLDKARTPSEVLAMAGVYIVEKINASNLPNP